MPVTGQQLVDLLRSRVGEAYVLGNLVPKDDPDWHAPRHVPGVVQKTGWDCAELGSWGVYTTTKRLVGTSNNAGNPHTADAYTGYWKRDVEAGVFKVVTPEVAAGTVGGILLRNPPPEGGSGHWAMARDGRGGSIEAYDTSHGVIESSLVGRRFDTGILLPWVSYSQGNPISLRPSPVLKVGSTGADVRALQRALNAAGYGPLVEDGAFGNKTSLSVVRFQKDHGLVADGEVGPRTRAALGF